MESNLVDYGALEQLVRLRDQGALSPEEFEDQKRILLECEDGPVSGQANLKERFFADSRNQKIVASALIVGLCALIFTVPTLTGSGDSPGDVAARLYEEQANAPLGRYGAKDRCDTASEAAAAYLEESNSEQYERYKHISDRECRDAEEAQETIDEAQESFEELERALRVF